MPTYATVEDYRDYIADPQADLSAAVLDQASRIIDGLLITAVYDTDEDGKATDPATATAMKRATCAQAQWFDELGDTTGVALYGSTSIGSVSLAGGPGSRSSATDIATGRIAPQAVTELRLAGLLNQEPMH